MRFRGTFSIVFSYATFPKFKSERVRTSIKAANTLLQWPFLGVLGGKKGAEPTCCLAPVLILNHPDRNYIVFSIQR